MRTQIDLTGDYLKILERCGGYYSCPKDASGNRLGPLVCYAGEYKLPSGSIKKYVGDVYANFANAEPYPEVLGLLAYRLKVLLDEEIDIETIDVLVGLPIGGYSLSTAVSLASGIPAIKAEKKVLAVKTEDSKERSTVIFGRHSVKPGQAVVLIEDTCNNFSTTTDMIYKVEQLGGRVVAIACFLNRSLTVKNMYSPGKIILPTGECKDLTGLNIPVISLVQKPIPEYKQDDPAVALDVIANNVAWDPKKEWDHLMAAMSACLP